MTEPNNGKQIEPKSEDLIDPIFNAIWNCIKEWDLERRRGDGYAGATGTDVMAILEAIKIVPTPLLSYLKEKKKELEPLVFCKICNLKLTPTYDGQTNGKQIDLALYDFICELLNKFDK